MEKLRVHAPTNSCSTKRRRNGMKNVFRKFFEFNFSLYIPEQVKDVAVLRFLWRIFAPFRSVWVSLLIILFLVRAGFTVKWIRTSASQKRRILNQVVFERLESWSILFLKIGRLNFFYLYKRLTNDIRTTTPKCLAASEISYTGWDKMIGYR